MLLKFGGLDIPGKLGVKITLIIKWQIKKLTWVIEFLGGKEGRRKAN
jgi:hypothetical protein